MNSASSRRGFLYFGKQDGSTVTEDENRLWATVSDPDVEDVLRLVAFVAVLALLVLHVARYVVLDAVALVLVAALVLLTYLDYARRAVSSYLSADLGGEVRRLEASMPEEMEVRNVDGDAVSTVEQDVFFHVERDEPGLALAVLLVEIEDVLRNVASDLDAVSDEPSTLELHQLLEFGGGFEGLENAPDGLSDALTWSHDLISVLTRGVAEGVEGDDATELARLGFSALDYLRDAEESLAGEG